MIALLLSIALAAEPAEPAEPEGLLMLDPVVEAQAWGITVNAPVVARIWVPLEANLSSRAARADEAHALPSSADGRALPSPWARRSRTMRSDGTVSRDIPTREHPETGEMLVRKRPQLGVRVTLVTVGAVLAYATAAGVAAGPGSTLRN
ncbi:MAG: hypothetical protein KC912_24910 [Proteobacteria bacterium]|nr:hypothetical protein [Pseudomonadota bacterium]